MFLSRDIELYDLYNIYISAVISRGVNPPDLYMWFGGYIEFFLAYNFILHEEEKVAFEQNYNRFIDKVKTVIIQSTRLDDNQFNMINITLKNFESIY